MIPQKRKIRIFCCYAHEDRYILNNLKKQFAVLLQQKEISFWYDREIPPGTNWKSEINRHLDDADIILLLLSPDFMVSEYCQSVEMHRALERHKVREAHVIPILLKPTLAWQTTPLGDLQALPPDGKPITAHRDRANSYAEIAMEIHRLIKQIQWEDVYPVQGYCLQLTPFVIQKRFREMQTPERIEFFEAERYLKDISDVIGGTMKEIAQTTHSKQWVLTHQHKELHLTITPDSARDFLVDTSTVDITLTASHLTLLDQFVRTGSLCYRSLEWLLANDLNVDALIISIHERTGKRCIPSTCIEQTSYAEYRLYESNSHSIRVTFSPRNASSPARICLIHDGTSYNGFYRAHELFSIRKVLSILYGEILYKQIRSLIEEIYVPAKTDML